MRVCHACLMLIGSWKSGKKLKGREFLRIKLVRVSLQETNDFLGPMDICVQFHVKKYCDNP